MIRQKYPSTFRHSISLKDNENEKRHFRLSVLSGLLLCLIVVASCSSKKPTVSTGGEEIICPEGSANPGATIRTINCSTVVQYEGNDFQSQLSVDGLLNAGVKNADVVLRQVSDAANEAQIQFTQMCESFNGCNMTSGDFNRRLEETQNHFRMIREKVALLQASKANPEVLRYAFAELYKETVGTAKEDDSTLKIEFSTQARSPNGTAGVVKDGDILHTRDEVVFGIRTSQEAYVYIFQKKSSGQIEVLFPNPDISGVVNPIPANELIRIPPQGQVFTLDDQDLGNETVYIATSKTKLVNLDAALANVSSGSQGAKDSVAEAMVDLFKEGSPECTGKTRGMHVTNESECDSMTRGLKSSGTTDDDFFSNEASVQGQAFPWDDVLLRTFQFQHKN